MPHDQKIVHREAPEGMETKDTRQTIGYSPSPVPHADRTGSELSEDERRKADQHGDWAHGGSGVLEADADNSGIVTASGGTQSRPALGSTENAGTVKRAKS